MDAIARVTEIAASVKRGWWRNKGYCALITPDIRNVFNTARWDKIMLALVDRKTPTYLLHMMDSYLSDRLLIYDTEDGPAEYAVTADVPQGSVLGPFIWNIMYDDLLRVKLPDQSEMIGFADDVAMVATARTTHLLEIVANESLRPASSWLKESGLEPAVHKTEAVLITDKREFIAPWLMLDGQDLTWQKPIRYLGVQTDSGLRFTQHVNIVSDKAAAVAVALARLMPNVEGPSKLKRRLLNSVAHSKILYGAEVWADATENVGARQRLISVQRRSAIRTISAYRTVSANADLVLASTPPIDLLARERSEIYQEIHQNGSFLITEATRMAAIENARLRLLTRWQKRWDGDNKGRWTYRLIPNIVAWYGRSHGQVNYELTQALTGHDCFNKYLTRFEKRDSDACSHCGYSPDNAQHAVFECPATEEKRKNLKSALENRSISEENLISIMFSGEDTWNAVSFFIRKTMLKQGNWKPRRETGKSSRSATKQRSPEEGQEHTPPK